jgi:hypothetical protein
MVKRGWYLLISITVLFYGIILLSNCKTAEDNNEQDGQLYQLDVKLGEGVTGTPETGTYTYEEEEVVFYNYSLEPSYSNLVVTFDDEKVEPSGTVTITESHTLQASATPIYNITGTWTMNEEYDDGSSFSVMLSFTGNTQAGTVTDSQGGTGTYNFDNKNNIEFTLNYTDIVYEYDGTFEDVNTLEGDCKRIISGETFYGTWEATRTNGSTSRKSSGTKYSKNQ